MSRLPHSLRNIAVVAKVTWATHTLRTHTPFTGAPEDGSVRVTLVFQDYGRKPDESAHRQKPEAQ